MKNPMQIVIKELGGQVEVAKACGVSQNAISKWSRGQKVSLENALKLEKVTNKKVKAEDFDPTYAELLSRN